MKTDPFSDILAFLVGATPDHVSLGPLRYPFVALYAALLVASIVIARANWRWDPAQRTAANFWTLLFRVLMGSMWFQGSIWKLPLPVSAGFRYWTEQLVEHSWLPLHAAFVRDVLLPNIHLLDPVVWVTETLLAASLMLGVGVRLASAAEERRC